MANQLYARVAWAMLRLLYLIRDISTTLPVSLGGEVRLESWVGTLAVCLE
jgi:hypothetical protein